MEASHQMITIVYGNPHIVYHSYMYTYDFSQENNKGILLT